MKPFTHNKRKYDFKEYWKATYSSLQFYKYRVELEVKMIQENYVIQETKDCIIMPTIVQEDLCKYYAELDYLRKVLWVRSFWRPRDWLTKMAEAIQSGCAQIHQYWSSRKRERVLALGQEERMAYYRQQVQKIEKRLKKLFPEETSDCMLTAAHIDFEGPSKELKKKAKELLSKRRYYLDLMFQATDVEVKRMEDVSDTLRLYTQFLKKHADKWADRDKGLIFDDEPWSCCNDANLCWAPGAEGTILPYEGDDFYGSDFNRMIDIENAVLDDLPCASILIYPEGEDEEGNYCEKSITGDYDNEKDDWKIDNLNRPELEHIKMCHAVHDLLDHLKLPIVDLLHVNSYHLDFKRENSIYLDITETHHPKGFGLSYRREEYEEAMKKL